MDTAEYYSDGAGSAPCEPVSIMGLRSYYDLRNSPSSTTFLTTSNSRGFEDLSAQSNEDAKPRRSDKIISVAGLVFCL